MKKLLILLSVFFPVSKTYSQLVLSGEETPNKKVSDISSIHMIPGFKVIAEPGTLYHSFIDANGDGIPDSQQFGVLPTFNQNYIKSTEYLTENGESGDKKTVIVYYDGLGREKQSVQVGATPLGKDLIVHYEYDGFGRPVKDFLPVPSSGSSGSLVANPLSAYNSFYGNSQTYNTRFFYSEKKLEDSPLNRVLKQAAPGDGWKLGSGHEIKFEYQTNTGTEVKLYRVQLANNFIPSLVVKGNYPSGSLYKAISKDENWTPADGLNRTTEEFKDLEGRIVLKRTYNIGQKHDTYYVYDLYGNLTFVLPPLLGDLSVIGQQALDELAYQYRYDERNRLVEKKLPGKGWEYRVYDKQDRLVLSQDGNQKGKQWNFSKYDKFGRVVYSGLFSNKASRENMQRAINSMLTNTSNNEQRVTTGFSLSGQNIFYTKKAFPTGSMTVLTINYYDSYLNTGAPQVSSVEGQNVLQDDFYQRLKGLTTASFSQIIGTNSWNRDYPFYDKKNRPVRILTKNYLGGFTQVDSKLELFRGKTEYMLTYHGRENQSKEVMIKEEFTYDKQERLLTHTHRIDGGAKEYLSQNSYDELGQLVSKGVGNNQKENPLQRVQYSYNIRGWLTNINNVDNLNVNGFNSLFAFRIGYDLAETTSALYTPRLYNGNISETHWRTATDRVKRSYTYRYDALNQLTDAYYFKGFDRNSGSFQIGYVYDEKLSYDRNGNILSLYRTGEQDMSNTAVAIDDLRYQYKTDSNQLLAVTDQSAHPAGFTDGNTNGKDYLYDANGNMISDKNKGITSIIYNHLNLPTKITTNQGTISYLYDANGVKMEKSVVPVNLPYSENTQYLGGFQYHQKPGRGFQMTLQFFPHAEGYVRNTQNGEFREYSYVYNYTDHLGNVRLSYTKNTASGIPEVLEESNYYPFGLKHSGYNTINKQPNYRYKYNGKELQEEFNLNIYDYGARNYDPAIGRWFNMDLLAEEYRRWSPYTYAVNNPIRFIDPDGMSVDDWVKRGNQIFYDSSVSGTKEIQAKYGETASKIDAISYYSSAERTNLLQRYTFNSDGSFTQVDLNANVIDRALGNTRDMTYRGGGNTVMTVGGDAIMRFGATIDLPSSNPFQGKSQFEVVMVDTNPIMPAIAGSVAPLLGFASGSAQTYSSFRDGNYIGGTVGLATLGVSAKMSGSFKQWYRYGPSHSREMGIETIGHRWGASPYHARTKIPNPGMQKLNQLLRQTRLPFGDKLQRIDPGHYHVKPNF